MWIMWINEFCRTIEVEKNRRNNGKGGLIMIILFSLVIHITKMDKKYPQSILSTQC